MDFKALLTSPQISARRLGEIITDTTARSLHDGAMKSILAQQFQKHHLEFAMLLDELLSSEKRLYNYPSPDDQIETYGFYPRDPAELTYMHLTRGHFTEAVEALARIFGPCKVSREACFLQAGFYPGEGPDLEELRAKLGEMRMRL